MQLAIATVCLSGALEEKLQAVAAAGFKSVEIFEADLLSASGTAQDVRRMCADLGLSIACFQPFRDFEGMPPDKRARTFARAERKFDLMAELGTDLMLICSNIAPDALPGLDRAADDFADLGGIAQKRGLRVAFEALSWGRHVNDYRDSWEVVRQAAHPAVGLALDSFHICARRTELKSIRNIPGDRIFLVQLADAPMLDMDFITWGRHFRSFPGQGEMPVLEFAQALQATRFDGLLSLEIFNDQFRAGSARHVAVDGHRALINLMDRTAVATGRTFRGVDLLPPRSRCRGTAFIEFAVDETTAPALERLVAGLGFARAGQHKTKAVTRWRQGDVNLVLNRENDGFAHAFNITHGTSVCAIGLTVDDAAMTLDRARKLLDQPFRQEVAPGELDIPAVRGLGGSLVYFIDGKTDLARVWDIEFDAVPAERPDRSAGLLAVDHISQSMHYEEMLSWLLFYASLLDLEKSPEQSVLDPGGVVKSLVVQDQGGALRLVLNASQSARTQSARFLDETFGSGVQHIAFATSDIFTTVARLRANGVALLEIPENYYDDLEAKTDLTDAEIERLRTHDVLYERDAAGEYLQAYTETFDDRFFFEIVERRGAYRGFGATNAQIRLTAQARRARPAAIPKA
jgi:4-hydroxyphenylpyruvate dioxygenase